MEIAVVGAGSWGTVLAQILDDNKQEVTLWVRNPEKAEKILATRVNHDYLPELHIAPSITVTGNLEKAIKRAEVLVFVVPSKGMTHLCEMVKEIDSCKDKIIISCTKGFDLTTGKRMSEIIKEMLPECTNLAVMSGPNLAKELAKRQPGATVIASDKLPVATKLQELFINTYFRPYVSQDVLGVELCGCLKNSMAIVSGMMAGLEFGENSQAALITRGLAEIKRLGIKLGAKEDTFNGLAGVGDMIATCTSTKSRNRSAGFALGKGKTLEEIYDGTNMVIEGINTAKSAHALAKKYDVDMPITEQLYEVLFKEKSVHTAILDIMKRKARKE